MADAVVGEITDAKGMKSHLSSGNLAHAYLFYGEEEYLKDLYVSRLKKLGLSILAVAKEGCNHCWRNHRKHKRRKRKTLLVFLFPFTLLIWVLGAQTT